MSRPAPRKKATTKLVESRGRVFRADRLAAQRKALGLTQLELAIRANVDPMQLSRFERGVVEPSCGALARIARTLGCSADYLLGLAETPTPPK